MTRLLSHLAPPEPRCRRHLLTLLLLLLVMLLILVAAGCTSTCPPCSPKVEWREVKVAVPVPAPPVVEPAPPVLLVPEIVATPERWHELASAILTDWTSLVRYWREAEAAIRAANAGRPQAPAATPEPAPP